MKKLAFNIEIFIDSDVKFIYCGKVLKDEELISYYNINKKDKINAFIIPKKNENEN